VKAKIILFSHEKLRKENIQLASVGWLENVDWNPQTRRLITID